MKPGRLSISVLFGVSLLSGAEGADSDQWTDFRGPQGTGHLNGAGQTIHRGLPTQWSESENLAWKTRIPLTGLSSPVVQDGKVWMTTADETGHDYHLIGVDARTGKILAHKRVFHWENPQSLGNGKGQNCYATPSAVVEPGRVYAHFGSSGTACLDTETFEVLWARRDIPCWHYRGASSSPVLFKDTVILTMDGADLQYHIALDKKTGKTQWRTPRSVAWNDEDVDRPMVRDGDWRKAHSTPILSTFAGEARLYSVGAKAVYGYDPHDGREVWRAQFYNWSAAPRPVLYQDHLIFVTGYGRAELCALNVAGTGDVTETHYQWRVKKPVPRYASPIVVDDRIYVAAEESFISCLNAKTGNTIWTERVGGQYRASPLYADGKLYFFSMDGSTAIIEPGDRYQLIRTNHLEGGASDNPNPRPPGFVASPAVSGRALILRTRDYLYRIEHSPR